MIFPKGGDITLALNYSTIRVHGNVVGKLDLVVELVFVVLEVEKLYYLKA